MNEISVGDHLRDYQQRYYSAMERAMNGNRRLHSLVCLPTGGGKTRLAVVFLINNALLKGQKVLWIAHSQYLLNQAYDTFSDYLGGEWMALCSVLIHSGVHEKAHVSKVADIADHHKLIICSFQSLQRSKTDWKGIIGDNVFIVVDEAHHIVAPSFYELLCSYISGKHLVGLTATPIRAKVAESSQLYQIFSNDLGIRVHMTELFQKHYLVLPLFEIVNYNNEQLAAEIIENVDELSQWLADGSVDGSNDYNEKIVDKYLSDSSKYGKTVIFAIDKRHADSLYEEFCRRNMGEKVFLVYSGLEKHDAIPSFPAGGNRDSQFEAFKESKDGILININVLNEGVDIPDIQTVFMAKPLNSIIAVTQIIGRALRASEGKKCAYVVNFAVSNLGKKILMVMPKTAYMQYAAEWEGDEAADEYEKNEERVSQLEEMAEKAKKKSEICSFSDICLAGNYTLLGMDEQEDIPVPVSFKEYRKIERFRKSIQNGKDGSFPKRLFFSDIDADVIKKAFQDEGERYVIDFKPYDEELIKCVADLLDEVKATVKSFYQEKKARKDYIGAFAEKYQKLNDGNHSIILWYLNQVGIRSQENFVYFMLQELPEIKRQIREEI